MWIEKEVSHGINPSLPGSIAYPMEKQNQTRGAPISAFPDGSIHPFVQPWLRINALSFFFLSLSPLRGLG